MDNQKRIIEIDNRLKTSYPQTTALEFSSPWGLLVATVLAAQCTDERVNKTTRELFAKFPDPSAFKNATLEEIEKEIFSTGFYKQKAKSLKALNTAIVEDFGGQMPKTLEDLIKLPGVGRKTANLVLGNALGVPGVFVDTHVGRIATRLGLTTQKDPDKIEADLAALLPPARMVGFCNQLTHFGRAICTAKKPKCPVCPLNDLCPKVGVA